MGPTLSEAILLGSIGTKQAKGALLRPDGSTCAMGAAFSAVGIKCAATLSVVTEEMSVINNNAWAEGMNRWPILRKLVAHPMCTPFGKVYLSSVIVTLNDCFMWTRPQIAAWVAKLEAEEVQGANEECVANLSSKS